MTFKYPRNTFAAACGNCGHSWEDCDSGIRKYGKCDFCECRKWLEPEYGKFGNPINIDAKPVTK